MSFTRPVATHHSQHISKVSSLPSEKPRIGPSPSSVISLSPEKLLLCQSPEPDTPEYPLALPLTPIPFSTSPSTQLSPYKLSPAASPPPKSVQKKTSKPAQLTLHKNSGPPGQIFAASLRAICRDNEVSGVKYNQVGKKIMRKHARTRTEVITMKRTGDEGKSAGIKDGVRNQVGKTVKGNVKDSEESEIVVQEVNLFEMQRNSWKEMQEEVLMSPESSGSLQSKANFFTPKSAKDSFVLFDTHFEMLNDLSRSVNELNARLTAEELVSSQQIKENSELKSTIINLECRIDDLHCRERREKELKAGCTEKCEIF